MTGPALNSNKHTQKLPGRPTTPLPFRKLRQPLTQQPTLPPRRPLTRPLTELFGQLLRREEGNAVVLVALSMVVMLGMAALVTDVGTAYLERARLSNAVDAASLAGAQHLVRSQNEAENDARHYAALNHIDLDAGELLPIEIDYEEREIAVAARRNVPLLFARVLGFFQMEVSSRARANSQPGMGLLPIGILQADWEDNFGNPGDPEAGDEYVLKGKSHTDSSANRLPGWYGGLRAPGEQGASDFQDNIAWGIYDELETGDELDQEPGVMSGPTAEGAQIRIGLSDCCDPDDLVKYYSGQENLFSPEALRACPRLVIIPVVKETAQNKNMEITGFELFYLLEVEGLNPSGQGNANSSVIGVYLGPYEMEKARSFYATSLVE